MASSAREQEHIYDHGTKAPPTPTKEYNSVPIFLQVILEAEVDQSTATLQPVVTPATNWKRVTR